MTKANSCTEIADFVDIFNKARETSLRIRRKFNVPYDTKEARERDATEAGIAAVISKIREEYDER